MYKEPITSEKQNRGIRKRIRVKMAEVAAKVADPDQSDADFLVLLIDLCTLNRMADSHLQGLGEDKP